MEGEKVALLYFIFTRHFLILMFLILFYKHANNNGIIKFLYHICIDRKSVV